MNAPRPMLASSLTVEELEQLVERVVRRELEARGSAPAANDAPEWLDARQAAQILGVHQRTVRRLVARGLPHLLVGKVYRFKREDVVAWLEAGGENGPDVSSGT